MGKYKGIDADSSITVKIENRGGTCGDPQRCIVALAFKRLYGRIVVDVQVGMSITKIFFLGGTFVRYATPSKIRRVLPIFDKTKKWELEDGDVTFNPPSSTAKLGSRPSRWDKESKTKQSPGQDAFKARSIPTRNIRFLKEPVVVEIPNR